MKRYREKSRESGWDGRGGGVRDSDDYHPPIITQEVQVDTGPLAELAVPVVPPSVIASPNTNEMRNNEAEYIDEPYPAGYYANTARPQAHLVESDDDIVDYHERYRGHRTAVSNARYYNSKHEYHPGHHKDANSYYYGHENNAYQYDEEYSNHGRIYQLSQVQDVSDLSPHLHQPTKWQHSSERNMTHSYISEESDSDMNERDSRQLSLHIYQDRAHIPLSDLPPCHAGHMRTSYELHFEPCSSHEEQQSYISSFVV